MCDFSATSMGMRKVGKSQRPAKNSTKCALYNEFKGH